MITDNSGNYYTFEKDPSNIDYYIAELFNLKEMLNAIICQRPETREAILNASYKDIITLRCLMLDNKQLLNDICEQKSIALTLDEINEIVGLHPFSYGND